MKEEKEKYHMISHVGSKKPKNKYNKLVVARGEGVPAWTIQSRRIKKHKVPVTS